MRCMCIPVAHTTTKNRYRPFNQLHSEKAKRKFNLIEFKALSFSADPFHPMLVYTKKNNGTKM